MAIPCIPPSRVRPVTTLRLFAEELLRLSADADGQVPDSGPAMDGPDLVAWSQRFDLPLDELLNVIAWVFASSLVDGKASYRAVDWLMNGLAAAWLKLDLDAPDDTFFAIYEYVDSGEFRHPGDDESVDPVVKYTLPGPRRLLASDPPPGMDRASAHR